MKCHTKSMEPEISFDVFIFKVSRPMNYALLIAMKHFIFRLCSSLAVVAINCALKYVCWIERIDTYSRVARSAAIRTWQAHAACTFRKMHRTRLQFTQLVVVVEEIAVRGARSAAVVCRSPLRKKKNYCQHLHWPSISIHINFYDDRCRRRSSSNVVRTDSMHIQETVCAMCVCARVNERSVVVLHSLRQQP